MRTFLNLFKQIKIDSEPNNNLLSVLRKNVDLSSKRGRSSSRRSRSSSFRRIRSSSSRRGRRSSSSRRRRSYNAGSKRFSQVQQGSTRFEEVQRVCRFEPSRWTTPNTTKRFASTERVRFRFRFRRLPGPLCTCCASLMRVGKNRQSQTSVAP